MVAEVELLEGEVNRALSAVSDLDAVHTEKGVRWSLQGKSLFIYAVVFSSVADTSRGKG